MLIFVVGPPSSGCYTQSCAIAERLKKAGHRAAPVNLQISLSRLAASDTLINNFLHYNRNIEDTAPLFAELLADVYKSGVYDVLVVTDFGRTQDELVLLPDVVPPGTPFVVIELTGLDRDQLLQRRPRACIDETTFEARYERWTKHRKATLEDCMAHVHPIDAGGTVDEVTDCIMELFPGEGQQIPLANVVPALPPGPDPVPAHFHGKVKAVGAIERARCIQATLQAACSRRLWKQFPGTHPVSVTKSNLYKLGKFPYAVSPKVDGTRYLVLVLDTHIWFMNRKLQVFKGPRHPDLQRYQFSLLDCEVCSDSTVVVIDVVGVSGRSCRSHGLFQRLKNGRWLLRALNYPNAPFTFQQQVYTHVAEVGRVATVGFADGYDGIIFTPVRRNYRLGRSLDLLKWKELEDCTVDLLLKDGKLHAAYYGEDKTWCVGKPAPDQKPLREGCVYECTMVENTKDWSSEVQDIEKAMKDVEWDVGRLREDRDKPNFISVVENILQSIEDDVTLGDIRKAVPRRRRK